MSELHIDIETRSAVDLKKVGAYRYAEDSSTSIILGSYKLAPRPIAQWREELVKTVRDHIAAGGRVVGHNQQFERAVLNAKGGAGLRPEDMDCTMARALAVGLPASLEGAGAALKLSIQKDKAGHRLMLKLCKPKKVHADGRIEWHDDPAERAALAAYCDRDVETEAALHARLPRLSDRERRVWVLDQTINDRGVQLDVPLVQAALGAVADANRRADRRIWELTNGAADRCGQVARIAAWVRSRGIACDSIAKGEFDTLVLKAELFDDPVVEDVLRLRRATTHMFRFDKMLACVCRDGRLRGLFQYHKAATGRWSGWSQSFPRVDSPEAVEAALDELSATGRTFAAMETLSECHRPMLIAPPGKKLTGGDFSNIEGRVAAWVADERWKTEAFKAYDAGTGPDLYRVAAARMGSEDRQFGKTGELAGAYQGGPRAVIKAATNANIKMSVVDAKRLVVLWREANPRIVQAWWDLQDAAIGAVEARGCVVPVLGDRVRYVSDGRFLYCRLPSGRTLHYASPSVRWKTRTIKTEDGDEIELTERGVTYFGVDFGNKWGPIDLYGGMQFNHVVQGFARDLLVEAMFMVENAGYRIVHHTHDDLVCEVDAGFGNPEDIGNLMASAARSFAPGLPVSVKSWEGERWIK